MSKISYVALVVLCSMCVGLGAMAENKSHKHYPSDMRFYMYCEKCSECGYEEKEVEFSKVSNLGNSHCPQCLSSYEFSLDKDGNKILENGEN